MKITYKNTINISDSEWEVMRVIWTLKVATAQDILSTLGDVMNWKTATIKTLLRRLVDKGVLETHKDGKRFIYSSLVTEEEAIDNATEDLFGKVCAKKVGSAIADVIDRYSLTQDDIELIHQRLAKKVPVNNIECDCLPNQCKC